MRQLSKSLISHRGIGNAGGVGSILPKPHIAHQVAVGQGSEASICQAVKVQR